MKILNILIEGVHQVPKFLTQILISAFISAAPALPVSLLDRLAGWYIDNSVFLTMVFGAVVLDYAIGTYVHLMVKRDFNMKKNYIGLLVKGFAVCAGYVLFEMVRQIVNDVQFIAIYFKVILQLTVILYPTISALKNISILTNGEFPPDIWFKKFNKFNKDLDLQTFKTTTDEKAIDGVNVPNDSEQLPEQSQEENPPGN